jgi:Mn2+/Fe2+ NRAMP family transporter
LISALFVNSAILIVGAATFHFSGNQQVAEIQDAYQLLTPLLGSGLASLLFSLALLASGQSSTFTGTIAGQDHGRFSQPADSLLVTAVTDPVFSDRPRINRAIFSGRAGSRKIIGVKPGHSESTGYRA